MNLKSVLKSILIKSFILIFCSLIAINTIKADSEIKFPEEHFSLYQNFTFRIDTFNNISLQSILNKEHVFDLLNQKQINLSYQKNACWIHFKLVCKQKIESKNVLTITNPLLDKNTLFFKVNNNIWDSISIVSTTPLNKREFLHQFPVFNLPNLNAHDTIEFYLKTNSGLQVYIPLQIASETETNYQLSDYNIMMAIYVGIMFFMFMYNLFVFISVKDRNYFFYVVYVFFITLAQIGLSGFSIRFLIPDNPSLNPLLIVTSSVIAGIGAIAFASHFLMLKKFYPILNKGLILFYAAYVSVLIFYLCGYSQIAYKILDVAGVLIGLYAITFSILVSLKKYRPATFFLLAWSLFIFSLIIFVLKNFGIAPDNLLTNSSLQWGSAAESLLLSFALADKINTFRKEKEIAQKEALFSAQENERIVREQNVILETKVTERTIELKETNTELSKTLDELKSAQTLLVESEKMASLGQLTAGIAHEINNPINFVTSNISPLKRDIDSILTLLEKVENISLSQITISEKQKQIDELKQDVDFDYLKTEIDFLMKGIQEGSFRTAEIVKGLRLFSRLDEDDLKSSDINEGIDSTLIILNNQIGSDIKITKNYGALPLVECYPGKINQVFLNILSNAIYAVKEKHKESGFAEIIITTKIKDNHLILTIEDNGKGMSEETKHKLFEPFYTTKPVGEGTGLGLSIVYNIIKKHNGTIKVTSDAQQGTQFEIEIPLIQHLS